MKQFLLVAIGIVGRLLQPASLLGQSTIYYHQPAEPIVALSGVFEGNPGRQVFLDLNTDGIQDYVFAGGAIEVRVRPLGAHQQASVLATGVDLGSYLFALEAGTEIGPQLPIDVVWVDYLTPRHPLPGESSVGACADIGCIGYFGGGIDFMGVNFQMPDGFHYGWVRMQSYSWDAGAIVLDWAYETRPGVPIRAGAKPVPVPLASPLVVRPGYLRLNAATEIGKAYQVQVKDHLDASPWTNLPFVIPATTTNMILDLPMAATAQFFRVVDAD